MNAQPKSPVDTGSDAADAEAVASVDAAADAGHAGSITPETQDADENKVDTEQDQDLNQDADSEEAVELQQVDPLTGDAEPLSAELPDEVSDSKTADPDAIAPDDSDDQETAAETVSTEASLDEGLDANDEQADENNESDSAEESEDPLSAEDEDADELKMHWYILKVQVNREESIRDALQRRVKIEELDEYFGDIVVPTEDIAEFTKSGKRRVVKKKLYPGYIMVHMAINDDTWFLVRETPGIGDFTGSAGKPTPMDTGEVERILNIGGGVDEGATPVKTAIPYKPGDRVRVKEGHFLNFEGDVESVDEANGRVTLMINIFGRSTPVELEHWQIESV